MLTRLTLLALLALLVSSCATDRRPAGDSGPRSDATGGVDAGPGLDAGPGVDAGTEVDAGPPPVACPADPPSGGSACEGTAPCQYVRCATEGFVSARCNTGVWMVTAAPCESFECFAETCGPDQLCLDMSGGAAFGECVDNPCGTAAVACGCLDAVCETRGDDCMYFGGREFRCAAGCDKCP